MVCLFFYQSILSQWKINASTTTLTKNKSKHTKKNLYLFNVMIESIADLNNCFYISRISPRQGVLISIGIHIWFFFLNYPWWFLENRMQYEVLGVDGKFFIWCLVVKIEGLKNCLKRDKMFSVYFSFGNIEKDSVIN